MTRRPLVLLTLMPLMVPGAAEARLVRLVIEKRTAAPAVPGRLPYEILRGHFEGEADPRDRHHRIITDIAAAPRNNRGKISYSATFAIARPVQGDGSGVLFYDVPNRGNARIAADPDGHIRVVSGWQDDIPPSSALQTATVPVASGPHDRPLTGPVLARFEKIFGTWKRCYGLRRMRWRGLAKAAVQVHLTAIAYNLKRTMNILSVPA